MGVTDWHLENNAAYAAQFGVVAWSMGIASPSGGKGANQIAARSPGR
jgi:hypothetical protein